jgi:hypothetical protein
MTPDIADLQSVYPDLNPGNLAPELRELLPRDKDDMERAERISALKYPEIAPVLPYLAIWLQDANWPVARVIAPCLIRVGAPLLPVLRTVLASSDSQWKYFMLDCVVRDMSPDVIAQIKQELQETVDSDEIANVQEAAAEILQSL